MTGIVALAAVLLVSCAGSSSEAVGAQTPGLEVVATTSILGDIASNLVGEDGNVTVLVPPGSDPHGFEPSAADAAALRDASLVVANGLGLEEQLTTALEAARDDGAQVIEVAGQLDPIAFEEADHGHETEPEGGEHGDQDLDPHVWFDPVRMADGVTLIALELASLWPQIPADEWEARAQAYNEQLLDAHDEMQRRFGEIPPDRRKLVTNHASFGYLADRYDFEMVGVVQGLSPQSEASAGEFAALIEVLDEEGVNVVFAEHTDSAALAEQLASEALGQGHGEIEVVRVHTGSLGEPGSGAETYLELLRTTTVQVADALG